MQANGQCHQPGQPQLTHANLSYNANCSNRGYENNTSYIGVGAVVGHYTTHGVEMTPQSTQRQNKTLTLHNHLSVSSHQDYYPNSAQNVSSQSNTPQSVSLNQQVMFAPTASMSGNQQSAVLNRNVLYYQSQVMRQKSLNQSLIPRMENVSVPVTSTSSTMQRINHTYQPAVQTSMYSQTSQQAAYAPSMSPSYAQNINVVFSNVPHAQNGQMYTVTPVTSSTSCDNKVVAINQSAQNNYFVSQKNDSRALHSVNGCAPLSNLMATNNVNSQSSSLTAATVQAPCPPYPSQNYVQQTSVKSNINIQTAQSAILVTNENHSLYTSLPLLPSQTCLQKDVSAQSHLQNMMAAPQHTTMLSKDHSDNQLDNSFYQKINDVSNNLNVCAPLNQASELRRRDALTKTDHVSSVQEKDCLLQVSPSRATRAVAVVLPLSQESSPIKHLTPSSLSTSSPASGSSLTSSNKLDKGSVKSPDILCLTWKLQKPTSNGNISTKSTSNSNTSTDKEDAQAPSPQNPMQLSVQDAGPRLSTLPLTFAQLVEGHCSAKLSKRRKSKSGNNKTQTRQKPCEEELSSVPTTEWTLKMLYEKILELENKENEHKSENKHDKNYASAQIVHQFWNGDYKALFNAAKSGDLSKEMNRIRDFCRNVDVNSVVLSQNQSKHLSRYQVLQHDEVYKEKNSYTSFWLNINQLHDIDEEFGLPYFLKYGKNGCVDAELKSKLGDGCQIEVKPAISRPEELLNKQDQSNLVCGIPTVNNTGTETPYTSSHVDADTEKGAEENKCVSNAQSNDASYSFKIEVLPPEKAKVIFDQVDCDSPQVVPSVISQKIPPNDQNQTFNVTTLEKICCIEKWKEQVFGLSTESKCKCEQQNQDEEKLDLLESTSPMRTVDLTDDDDIPLFTQESQNIQEDDKSTTTFSSEGADETRGSENDHHQVLCISTKSQQDMGTNKNISENVNYSNCKMKNDQSLELVQECRKEPDESGLTMTKTANSASSHPVNASEVKENNKRLASGNPDRLMCTFKKNKLSSHLKSQTILESFSKGKNSAHVDCRTVELALFGSKPKKCASSSHPQSQIPPLHTHTLPERIEAPRRIFVKFSPFKIRDKQEAKQSDNISVKARLHENWRNSFPLSTIRLRRKNKKFTIVRANHGTTIRLSPSKHKDKHVAKRKNRNSDDDQGRQKKRSRSESNGVNMLKKPVDDEVRPLQENILKFNVLPNTFNFKEGSNDGNSTTVSKADEKTVLVTAEESPPIVQTKGAWCDESTSKSSPQSPPSIPESVGLFQEFQRRYKMRQASTDE